MSSSLPSDRWRWKAWHLLTDLGLNPGGLIPQCMFLTNIFYFFSHGQPCCLGLSISFYHLPVPWYLASHRADSMSFCSTRESWSLFPTRKQTGSWSFSSEDSATATKVLSTLRAMTRLGTEGYISLQNTHDIPFLGQIIEGSVKQNKNVKYP